MTRRPILLFLLLMFAAASTLFGQILITNTSPLPQGYAGIAYTYSFMAQVQPPTLQNSLTWSVQNGPSPTLPSGITMSPNGTLAGTTQQTGTFTFVVIAQAGTFTTTMQFSLNIAQPSVIINTTSPLPIGIQGQFYTDTLSASSTPGGVTWQLNDTPLPPGLNLSPNGVISGNPTTPGVYTFSLLAEISNTTIFATKSFTMTVYAGQIVISTTSLPLAVAGKNYATTLGVTPQTVTWALTGVLPPGITFNTATGAFAGSSTVVGIYPIQVSATLTNYASASQNLTLYLTSGQLAIPQPVLPPAVQGSPYTTTVGATGGITPYQFAFANSSTNGLSISSTGTITGTPPAAGNFLLQVLLTDQTGTTITVNLSLQVATPLTVLTASLPNATLNATYSATLQGGGGTPPFSWLIVPGAGSLPLGLSLSTQGNITGTPTTGGSFSFTVQVTDSGGRTAAKALTISVSVGTLTITTNSLPNGQLTVPYSQTLTATGGVLPYTWIVAKGPLPAGLGLNTSGVLSGTPSGAIGTTTFTVQVTDSTPGIAPLSVQKTYTINIGLTLTITTLSLPGGTKGVAYPSTQIVASGGITPYTWSITSGALPGGLSLNSSSGVISGTPSATGTNVFVVTVNDAAGSTASAQLSLTINAPGTPLSITTSGSFSATVGAVFTQALTATGGTPPYTWSASGLPAGLQVSGNNITGTPTAAGNSNVSLTVTDSQQQTATGAIAITVSLPQAPPIKIGTISGVPATQPTPTLTLNAPYPVQLKGTLTASFQSSVGGSPTEVGFINSGGGKTPTATFAIAQNATNAVFDNAPVLATGTVAGTITLTATLNASGTDITPTPAPTETITISPAAPVMQTVTFSNSGGGLTVTVIGYSTTRDMVSGQFQFYTSSGPILTPVTVQLGTAFSTWYSSSASNQYGSQFSLTIPFTVAGTATDIVSVNATITNSQGSSQSLKTD
jgi:hypothetical protein